MVRVKLIALSCGQAPEGYGSWTLRLLASELVRLEIVESISPETVLWLYREVPQNCATDPLQSLCRNINATVSCRSSYLPRHSLRRVSVRERRTAIDWAQEVKSLLDEAYREAKRVILVCDNLNTHTFASLYKAFPAAEARRLCSRLELVFTPKHPISLSLVSTEFQKHPAVATILKHLLLNNVIASS